MAIAGGTKRVSETLSGLVQARRGDVLLLLSGGRLQPLLSARHGRLVTLLGVFQSCRAGSSIEVK